MAVAGVYALPRAAVLTYTSMAVAGVYALPRAAVLTYTSMAVAGVYALPRAAGAVVGPWHIHTQRVAVRVVTTLQYVCRL